MNEAVGNIPYLVTSKSLKEKLSEYFRLKEEDELITTVSEGKAGDA